MGNRTQGLPGVPMTTGSPGIQNTINPRPLLPNPTGQTPEQLGFQQQGPSLRDNIATALRGVSQMGQIYQQPGQQGTPDFQAPGQIQTYSPEDLNKQMQTPYVNRRPTLPRY
jgi:hypothetical protein